LPYQHIHTARLKQTASAPAASESRHAGHYSHHLPPLSCACVKSKKFPKKSGKGALSYFVLFNAACRFQQQRAGTGFSDCSAFPE
jgi:hypothetical protein